MVEPAALGPRIRLNKPIRGLVGRNEIVLLLEPGTPQQPARNRVAGGTGGILTITDSA